MKFEKFYVIIANTNGNSSLFALTNTKICSIMYKRGFYVRLVFKHIY